ncbi:GSCOCG00010099001-RA-CDS, partial [Cotesia congregata]
MTMKLVTFAMCPGLSENMADAELLKALKDLPNRVQTSSLKERYEVIHNVIDVLSNPGINEKIVNGICKVVASTLQRYKDNKSQYYVRNLIAELLKHQNIHGVKYMTAVITEQATWHQNVVPTFSTSLTAYQVLKWTSLVITAIPEDLSTHTESQKLIEAQASLSAAAVASANASLSKKVYSLLTQLWNSTKNSEKIYITNLSKMEPSNGVIVLSSLLIKHLVSQKKDELIDPFKNSILEGFIKLAISCKKKPDLFTVDSSTPFLRRLTHEDFKNQLLPALQKAMLRNPEIIIDSVGHILTGLSLDLSRYCEDISKGLFANLHSKEDSVRDSAADACRRLAL